MHIYRKANNAVKKKNIGLLYKQDNAYTTQKDDIVSLVCIPMYENALKNIYSTQLSPLALSFFKENLPRYILPDKTLVSLLSLKVCKIEDKHVYK